MEPGDFRAQADVELAGLFSMRLTLGLAEAPCYPSNSRILNNWFPQVERARAKGVYSVGQYVGVGFMLPVLVYIVATWGWRSLFFIVGGIGVVYGLIFWAQYRDPNESGRVSQQELNLIAEGGGLTTPSARVPFNFANIGKLLSKRQILGASIGQFCGKFHFGVFPHLVSSYLAEERHMDWIKSGFAASIPYIAASIGVLFGGYVSDRIIRATGSATLGRKLPIVAGLLMCSTMIAANYISDNNVVIAVMSIAFFGQGMVNLGWTPHLGCRSAVDDRPYGRRVQPLRKPRRYYHTDRGRARCSKDRLVLRRARVHRRARPGRGGLIHFHRRESSSRGARPGMSFSHHVRIS